MRMAAVEAASGHEKAAGDEDDGRRFAEKSAEPTLLRLRFAVGTFTCFRSFLLRRRRLVGDRLFRFRRNDLAEAREEFASELARRRIDEPAAKLRELAADIGLRLVSQHG